MCSSSSTDDVTTHLLSNANVKESYLEQDMKYETCSIDDNDDTLLQTISFLSENMESQSGQTTCKGSLPLDSFGTDMTHLTNGSSGENLLTKIKEEPVSEDDTEPMQADLPLVCMLCAKEFNCVTGLKAHVIAQHSYKWVKRKNNNCISPEKNKSNYVCAICRRNFTTSTDLMVHETCHNKTVCYGCNESFDTFEQLTKHSQTCKAIAIQEVKKLKTLDDVLRPQPQENPVKIKCKHCTETFSDMYYMAIHKEIHHRSALSENSDLEEDSAMEIEALENIFSDNSSF